MSATKRNFCGRTRREFLWQTGGGFGATALASLLAGDQFFSSAQAAGTIQNPLAAKDPHFAPKAKSVIFLFMYGGPSHIDTFDYKPNMVGMDGKTIKVKTFGRGGHKNQGRVVEPRWEFSQYGECGKWVSTSIPPCRPARGRHCVSAFDDGRLAHSWQCDADDE